MDSRRKPGGRLAATIAGAVLVALASLAAVGWNYSGRILGPDAPSSLREQRVFALHDGRIELSRDHESLEPGVWALEWEDGFGAIGAVIASDSTRVVREFRPVVGTPPVGEWASLRGVSRSATPASWPGVAYDTVSYQGPLGRYPAWFVPGRDSTWVIYTHGRAANRAEGLRTLSALAPRGLPGLLITYRNDSGAPRSPDGRYHLGLTEWQDLEAAVRWACDHGARDVVLEGYSMGGQIVMQFMARSPLAPRARAIVLESPALDWSALFARRARVLGVSQFATWLGRQFASARAGLDWAQLDRRRHTRGITTPILIYHNVADNYAPIEVSEDFARSLPGVVTLVRVEGGNHVEAWNVDPVRYDSTLTRWLAAHGIGRGSP